jgi:hypothetical protein
MYVPLSRRGSQVVRHGSAKAVFVGSIPTLASFSFLICSGKRSASFRGFRTPKKRPQNF